MKWMNLTLAAVLAILLCGSAVFAQQDSSSSSSSSSGMSMDRSMTTSTTVDTSMTHTDWSRRYVLTPVEYKRLRALGLTDAEVFAAANAAEATGMDLAAPNMDDPVQMILRGRAMWQIAQDLNIPVTELQRHRPEWESAEFKQAAERGEWYAHPSTMSTTTTTTYERSRTTTTTPSTTPPATSTTPGTTQ